MKAEDPAGRIIRHPHLRRKQVHTGHLRSGGVFQEVNSDGHEKLVFLSMDSEISAAMRTSSAGTVRRPK
jgi:hypothetical protein